MHGVSLKSFFFPTNEKYHHHRNQYIPHIGKYDQVLRREGKRQPIPIKEDEAKESLNSRKMLEKILRKRCYNEKSNI